MSMSSSFAVCTLASLPLRKCGLKSLHTSPILHGQGVTSLAEVWIEIYVNEQVDGETAVTSLAEVWIEIYYMQKNENWNESLPLRKCGLK